MSDPSSRLKVAIIGAGLAGAALAQALFMLSNLEVDVYESAPGLKEGGHGVGLAYNALEALKRLSPELGDAPIRAGGLESNSTRAMIGEGSHAGELIIELSGKFKRKDDPSEIIVLRPKLLEELLKGAPQERLHVGKKVKKVTKLTDDQHEIHFDDGHKTIVDAIIGADGIHGAIRGLVLGEDDPARNPVFTGFWHAMHVVPIQTAIDALGAEYINPNDPHQYSWAGDRIFILHDILSNSNLAQVIAAGYTDEDWSQDDWKKTMSLQDFSEKFGSITPVGNGVIQLFSALPEIQVLSQWEHKDARTYTDGTIALIGDAAHAMTPWQAAGAGQAIEDALVLATLLKQVNSRSDIKAAMKAYDQVRRPRTQHIVASSKEAGLVNTGQNKNTGLDPEKMRAYLEHKWDFIHDIDLDKHMKEAREAYALLKS